ncbi:MULTISPECIES: heparan-alpha-glucosaminide N-acetyltransferase domain-containing protein [Corynebacterium]|uniref:heparan-alpha-glucosaminide N-acetyltransferase domain-containing protein n=1 Tax=Corynebacterium TaxID=1716 RepID=UPI00264EC60C|nr:MULTISPECIES: heparan-alpha-glucosaminide N-acetyltransferase domain-containing protein [Corynebacterium]MDN8625264.1 heparan-alpha-glucosaminide N-acetyltransferase domain-containing protein [Corynebacterium kroppenstedtii]
MKQSIHPIEQLRGSVQSPRLPGIDVARALAIFGMIAAHVAAGPSSVSIMDPSTYPALVHGRPAVLFALLAGVSISLMTGRGERPTSVNGVQGIRLKLIGRALAIFLIGLVLEQLGTGISIILTFYGVLYAVALPFVWAKTRTLIIVGTCLGVVGPSLLAIIQYLLPKGNASPTIGLVLGGVYPLPVFWGILLLGMVLGRLHLQSTRALAGLVAVGVCASAIGYGVGSMWGNDEEPKNGWINQDDRNGTSQPDWSAVISKLKKQKAQQSDGVQPKDQTAQSSGGSASDEGIESRWGQYWDALDSTKELKDSLKRSLVDSAPHSGGTAEFVGSGGFALIVVALCQLIVSRARRWFIPIAVTGAMPLTIYTAHVIIVFAVGGPAGTVVSNPLYWSLVIGSIVFANVWMAFFGRGPLERFPRWLGNKAATQ